MAETHNEAEIKTDWPNVEGTVSDTAGTVRLSGNKFLVTEAEKSFVKKNDKVGM